MDEAANGARVALKLGGGETIDLAPAMPITLGDAMDIKKEFGVDVFQFQPGAVPAEGMYAVVSHMVRKVKPDVTAEQVRGVGLVDMQNALMAVLGAGSEADPT